MSLVTGAPGWFRPYSVVEQSLSARSWREIEKQKEQLPPAPNESTAAYRLSESQRGNNDRPPPAPEEAKYLQTSSGKSINCFQTSFAVNDLTCTCTVGNALQSTSSGKIPKRIRLLGFDIGRACRNLNWEICWKKELKRCWNSKTGRDRKYLQAHRCFNVLVPSTKLWCSNKS